MRQKHFFNQRVASNLDYEWNRISRYCWLERLESCDWVIFGKLIIENNHETAAQMDTSNPSLYPSNCILEGSCTTAVYECHSKLG